jgi:dihydrofolate reductase
MRTLAAITVSLDGYVTGPHDGPGCGLGAGGERLHHWVFGGPWRYGEPRPEPAQRAMHPQDRRFLDDLTEGVTAGLVGRGMFDAAGAWGGTNPFGHPLIVLTHRTAEAPDPATGFHLVDGYDAALARARELASGGSVSLGGGASLIRQGLAAGDVDELAVSTAPVVLGAGKRLFDGFGLDLDLEPVATYSSPFATHVRYRVLTRP